MKEKKGVNFSTRFTYSMDDSLNELSEIMMLTKQDLVRSALAEYIVKSKRLIDENIKYKNDENYISYDEYYLTEFISEQRVSKHIVASVYNEENEEIGVVDLIKIDVGIPERVNEEKVSELILMLNHVDEETAKQIISKINDITAPHYEEEITLKFTMEGLAVKRDPKLKVYLEKVIQEEINKVKEGRK